MRNSNMSSAFHPVDDDEVHYVSLEVDTGRRSSTKRRMLSKSILSCLAESIRTG